MTFRVLRLGLAGWRRRWPATALTFVLVALGSAALLLSLQLRTVATQPWQHTVEATHAADLVAFGPTESVGLLAGADGVVAASGPTPMVVTSMVTDGKTYGLRAFGLDEPPAVERPVLTEGRWMGGNGELVLERSLARVIGVSVGDTVDLRRTDGTAVFVVVGVAVSAREAPYPDNQPGEGYVRRADVAAMQPDPARWSWTQAVRLQDPAQATAVAMQVATELPREVRFLTAESRASDAADRHRATTVVLRTFSVTLLLAVALVLATLVSARVLDRSEELGLLKAVGFTPAQVVMVVAVEQVLVAVVAALVGAVGGSMVAPRIVRRSTELLGTVPVELSAGRIAAAGLIVVAVVAVAAAVPTLRLARAGVLRSMAGQRSGGTINRLTRRIALRGPLPVLLGVKQVLARPARSSATALALALTVGSLVAGLAFEATVAKEDALELQALTARRGGLVGGELAPAAPDPVAIVDSTREQLRPIVHGFNAVLVGVAIVNLLATALLSLRRRRRDLALTRAVGLTPQQVRRSVFCSDGLVGLVAALAGIPLGTAMFLGVYRIVNGDTSRAALPPLWQLAVVPLACVAAVIAVVAVPAHQSTGQSVTAGLRYE